MGTAVLVAATLVAWPAQLQSQDTAAGTVTFTIDFPNSDPEHYSITVGSNGHAKYECSARISQDSEDRESYRSEFEFSSAGRARVFDLTAQLNYFDAKIDSGKRHIAFTGAKKLSYQDAKRNNTAAYNYSTLTPAQELTAFFQSVGATLDFGRQLAYSHHYQKLALDDELKRMEGEATNHNLSELQAVRPILQEIYDDASVMNIVRARAQRLIEMSKVENNSGH